jgi:hypothetical protein
VNSSGILKWTQLTKLFTMFKLSLMLSLNIFGHQEGPHLIQAIARFQALGIRHKLQEARRLQEG